MEKPVAHQTDLLLIREVLAGSRKAQDQLIQRMGCIPGILNGKNRRLSYPFTREELKDLAQDVFASVWEKLESFSGRGCLEAWVYRFCHNKMMYAQRSRWRRQQRLRGFTKTDSCITEEDAPDISDRIALLEALNTLEADEVEVIQLKLFEGLSFSKVAERIRISDSSVKTRYYRGLKKLERKLSPLFLEDHS